MPIFAIDTNVFVEAAKGPYGFDIAPGFWDWLDQQAANGVIQSCRTVFDEICVGKDEIAAWVRDRSSKSLFDQPNQLVQAAFGPIAAHVAQTYPQQHSQVFLSGADAWVIARARVLGATVVTLEGLVPANSQKPKIPNVCQQFGVPWTNTYGMLRQLGARLNI